MTQPHLLVDRGDLADVALLPGDPGRVDRIASHCDEASTITENREYKVVNATYGDRSLSICSTGIGCPSAAIAVEELAAVGVETFIRVGTTGALQREIEIGDMIVATGAAKDEGTTKRYEHVEYPAVPDYEVLSALVEAARESEARLGDEKPSAEDGELDVGEAETDVGEAKVNAIADSVHVGPIVTDDAFYAETDEYVADWEDAGLLAVEMEAAVIFSLARRKGRRAGAICTVDGNLVEGTQKGVDTEDEELPEKARDNVGRAIDIALEATRTV